MKHGTGRSILSAAIVALVLSGCATYPHREPIEAYVADIEPLARQVQDNGDVYFVPAG